MTRKQVLDHGYVEYVEHFGSDERIIEAARMSTSKGFLGWGPKVCDLCDGSPATYDYELARQCPKCSGTGSVPGDEKLLSYLWNEVPKHTSPFEMAGMVIEVQAPIFVFREWHRHRTQSYNEMSARYTPLPDVNYIPSVERLMVNSKTNKQAGVVKGAAELTENEAQNYRTSLEQHYKHCETFYQVALQAGVPKELARIHLPVGRYSRMRASANLLNWLKFVTLRSHHKAQWEIRQFSDQVGVLLAEHFPRTWALHQNETRLKLTK